MQDGRRPASTDSKDGAEPRAQHKMPAIPGHLLKMAASPTITAQRWPRTQRPHTSWPPASGHTAQMARIRLCVGQTDGRLKKLPPPLRKVSTRLRDCGVTDEGCSALASALRSNPSQLRQLCLSLNEIGDLGVKRLCAGLEDPHCKLEILWLNDCGFTDEGCAALASALRSNPSHLRELSLTGNKLGKSVNLLSDVLQHSHCNLEILLFSYCSITDEGCTALASALRSNPSHLRELDLYGNKLGDSGVKRLCAGLKDPHCKLEILWLNNCGVTDEGCAALASALRSNPSHLRELDLSGNKLGKSGVKLLSDLKDDPLYKLERLYYCHIVYVKSHMNIPQCTITSKKHFICGSFQV
ncbi:hypothetical protein cypCar_00031389 [Cyprinus carpio]|nr:hypothetical protein cypCar_00031389 [Cyprinus carpio]